MPISLPVVDDLRARFKAGATPSALIRRIADRHPGEPKIDVLVRAYFREAFHVPMLRVGPEQVRLVAAGGGLPALNATVLPAMVAARPEWDRPDDGGCWLDAAGAVEPPAADLAAIPELAGSWDRMDDAAKQFVERVVASARSLQGRVDLLAALAEQLQQQAAAAAPRRAQTA